MTEQRFAKLIQNIADSVTVVNSLGEPVWSSSAGRHDLGYEEAFWHAVNLFELVHENDRAEIDEQYEKLISTPFSSVSGEVRLVAPDGSYHHVGYVARNMLDDDEIGGIVITSRNIDSEVQARSEREERQHELEEALADRSRFITRLSHEMRSPLHAIQGLAEVLLGSATVTDLDRQHVESIDREAVVLRRMIDDLLDLSKISAGHMELQIAPFMPAAIVDSIGLTNRPQAELKGLELRVEISPDTPQESFLATNIDCGRSWSTSSATPSSTPTRGKCRSHLREGRATFCASTLPTLGAAFRPRRPKCCSSHTAKWRPPIRTWVPD